MSITLGIREIGFKELESEEGQKIVVFYDTDAKSDEALSVLKQIEENPRFAAWEPVKVIRPTCVFVWVVHFC